MTDHLSCRWRGLASEHRRDPSRKSPAADGGDSGRTLRKESSLATIATLPAQLPRHALRTCRAGEGLSLAAAALARLLDQGAELPVAELDLIVNGTCAPPRALGEPLTDEDEQAEQW